MNTRTHPSAWALWPTLAATWVAFSHVVSFQGLFIWVIGGSILTAGIVLPLAFAHRRLLSVIAMLSIPWVIGFAAEYLGGDSAGPVTRSALMASAVTGAMCIVLAGRYPQWIVPISILLLGGALGLGAADQVLWLVGMWIVATALTQSMLGPYRQEHLRDRQRLIPFAAMLFVTGLVGVGALLVISPFVHQPWTIPGTRALNSGVAPGVVTETETETGIGVAEVSPAETESLVERVINWLVVALLVLLVLLLLWLVIALARRFWSSLRWRWLRMQLRRGTSTSQIIGAWTWVRLRRVRHDDALPVWMSPDIAAEWAHAHADPDLALVALNASNVYFGRGGDESSLAQMVESSWAAAMRIGAAPPSSLRQRWRWWARGPRVSELYCVSATS